MNITQTAIPEPLVPIVLRLVHDAVIAGHPSKERFLTAACCYYYWPTMRRDVNQNVEACLVCAHCKGSVPRPAHILEYST